VSGWATAAYKHLLIVLRSPEHDLTKSLAETYAVIGYGRGAKSLLVKRPVALAA
jgi:hypothetical protein